MTSTLFVVAFVAMVMTLNPGRAQIQIPLSIDEASKEGRQVFLYNLASKKYLFVSNDQKGGDNVVEANVLRNQPRYRFEIRRDEDNDLYRIYNPTYKRYLFVSYDQLRNIDRVVEAYAAGTNTDRIGERDLFTFERIEGAVPPRYRILCPSEGLYVFVSDEIIPPDNVVEAHPYANDPRNEFVLHRAN